MKNINYFINRLHLLNERFDNMVRFSQTLDDRQERIKGKPIEQLKIGRAHV